jgi:hypothetical protein
VLQLARRWVLPFVDPRQLVSILKLRLSRRTPAAPARSVVSHGRSRREPPFDPRYFYQAAWLGRLLAKARPALHIDVGSCVTDIGVLSAYVPIIYVDGRPLPVRLAGLSSVAGDITLLPFADKTLISMSSLHVTGLGRDGDPVELAAAIKGFGELQRVLTYRGSLYLSIPVGRERASSVQRIFAPETILGALPLLRLRRFSYVGDDCDLHVDAPLDEAAQQEYGCGLFEFERG